MTGGLRIVGNSKLRKSFTKDPKYRETNNVSCEKTKSAIIEGLNGILNGISMILIFGAINMA